MSRRTDRIRRQQLEKLSEPVKAALAMHEASVKGAVAVLRRFEKDHQLVSDGLLASYHQLKRSVFAVPAGE